MHSIIGGDKNKRRRIVQLVPGSGDKCLAVLMRRDLDAMNQRFAKIGRRYFLPGFSIVAGQVKPAIVGANPEFARLMRRSGKVGNRIVHFSSGPFVDKALRRCLVWTDR